MRNYKLKMILTGIVLVIIVILAVRLINFALKLLIPILIIGVIAYVVYRFVVKRR